MTPSTIAILSLNADPYNVDLDGEGGGQSRTIIQIIEQFTRLGISVHLVTRTDPKTPGVRRISSHPSLQISYIPSPLNPFSSDHVHQFSTPREPNCVDELNNLGIRTLLVFHRYSAHLARSFLEDTSVVWIYSGCSNCHDECNHIALTQLDWDAEAFAVKNANVVVTSTYHERGTLMAHYQNIEKDKFIVIPRPVDASIFQPRAILASGGRHTPQKGFDILFSALGEISDLQWTLFLFGGVPGDAVPTFAADRCWVLNILSPGDIAVVLNAADALVIPSRYETYGNLAQEALACGLPVIASDTGGLSEILGRSPSTELVAPDSKQELGIALRRWICAILHHKRQRHPSSSFDLSPGRIANLFLKYLDQSHRDAVR